ncbi:MAG: hypothetical protein R2750_08680 [Bacteroidales bacterium]
MYAYLITYITGILGIWKAVPVGLVFQLNPVMTWLMITFGAATGVVILYFLGKDQGICSIEKKEIESSEKEARQTTYSKNMVLPVWV